MFKDAVQCCSDPDLRENEASGNISGAGSHAFAVFISSFGFEIPHTCKNSSPSVDSCIVVCAVFTFFVLKSCSLPPAAFQARLPSAPKQFLQSCVAV